MALPSSMSKEEIYLLVVDTLHEMLELDKAKITPAANLYTDPDIDSIDGVDLAVKLKDMTDKRLQPEEFKSVRTIQDVVTALAALLVP